MSNLLVAAGLAAGLALGLLFYGGLWLTVRQLTTSRHPALLALASFWIRALSVIAGVVFWAPYGWRACAGVLAGFVLARILVSVLLRERRPLAKCT